ncbi:MAG: hypothetical protein WAM73_05330 [Desulfobacterales bacterium]
MTTLKRVGFILLAVIIWCGGIETAERFSVSGDHSFVATAEAIVGRPLTPVSVAGVARRTARRW